MMMVNPRFTFDQIHDQAGICQRMAGLLSDSGRVDQISLFVETIKAVGQHAKLTAPEILCACLKHASDELHPIGHGEGDFGTTAALVRLDESPHPATVEEATG